MKKIAFFVQHMLCGGVENALIALSCALIKAGNDVTIYVIQNTGDFIKKMPVGIHHKVIPLPKSITNILPVGGTKLSIRKNINERHYIRAAINLVNHFLGRSGFAELNVDFNKIPKLTEHYDIAVNFHLHSPFLVRYLSEKVSANKKIAWIHNDFKTTQYDVSRLQKYLICCDVFCCVSQQLLEEFTYILPQYKEKAQLALNIVPVDEIVKKGLEDAPEFISLKNSVLLLLSVGRLESQKGYDITIRVCKALAERGYRFKWFVLGEGSERKALELNIAKFGLENIIFLLGNKMNPYPYFRNCDIFVQTSRHEGYATTVTEAKIFRRPIICTDVAGAKEQIADGENGFVVNVNINDIVEKLGILISEPKIREQFTKSLDTDFKQNYEQYRSIFTI